MLSFIRTRWNDCCCCSVGLVLVCLSFEVHCFTFAWFIYRSLPVTGKNNNDERAKKERRLVTLAKDEPTNRVQRSLWGIYENVYGFYGPNLNQLRFNMIRLNYIKNTMYLTKERTPNTPYGRRHLCTRLFHVNTRNEENTESNPSELGCCARYSLIKIYGLSFPAKIRWNCVHSFRQRPSLLFRHLRTIPFRLSACIRHQVPFRVYAAAAAVVDGGSFWGRSKCMLIASVMKVISMRQR